MRINTVNHVDANVITRHCCSLIEQLIEWQKYTVREDDFGMVEPLTHSFLRGDQNVLVAAITLRDKLNQVIEKSAKTNTLPLKKI